MTKLIESCRGGLEKWANLRWQTLKIQQSSTENLQVGHKKYIRVLKRARSRSHWVVEREKFLLPWLLEKRLEEEKCASGELPTPGINIVSFPALKRRKLRVSCGLALHSSSFPSIRRVPPSPYLPPPFILTLQLCHSLLLPSLNNQSSTAILSVGI